MRNRITKLVTAVLVLIAILIGIKGFNGSTAWAKVIRALNGADNIHITTKVTHPDGRISEHRAWLKSRTMFRDEDPDEITIDNGENRLTLDLEKKTAQFSDSYSPFEDYMETGNFEIILLFRGRETPFKATELSDESTDDMRVYEITYRDTWKGKAWVDAKSHLPVRIHATFTEEYKDRVLAMEVTYDYQPIPVEMFSLTVPADYIEMPRIESRVFSGKVIDEKGEPVAGAEVVTSNEDVMCNTDERGEFVIKLHPGLLAIRRFPMIVRALKADDPNHVAWSLLRNPRHELRPLYRRDDGKTKLEQGWGVDIHLVDEKQLLDFIPGEPGKTVFENEMNRKPREITDVVLQMGPASVITGRIVDQEEQPIANAVVWIDRMAIAVGENEIEIRDLRHSTKEKAILPSIDYEEFDEIERKAFAITDNDGRYEIGHLPDVWYQVRLEVRADGYVPEAKKIFQSNGADFSLFRSDITIHGTVIDNYGQPLVGHKVEINIETDDETDFDIEDVMVDAQGRFKLTGIPAVDRLELQVRADEKPVYWDRNELTRNRVFVYYLMVEKSITFEPDKKEYFVEIVPQRPDITLKIEVKDSKGQPLKGIPVGISSPGFSERVWYLKQLNGTTDENGLCTIKEVPNIKPLNLWVAKPTERQMYLWEQERGVNQDTKGAIIECRGEYPPTAVTVEIEEGKKEYRISVTL